MAEDDSDRADETEAEVASEMERVDQNPDQVQEGDEDLGTQNAESGTPRDEAEEVAEPDDAVAVQEESQELPDDHQEEQWAESGGDEDLAAETLDADDEA